jgi:endoglucanase Acf2
MVANQAAFGRTRNTPMHRTLALLTLLILPAAAADTIDLGQASYHSTLPEGRSGPSDTAGAPANPRVTADFAGPPPTNTWWSSLIWERHPGNDYGQPVHAHPLSLQAAPEGLYLGHVTSPGGWDRGYEYSFSGGAAALTLGVEGMTSPNVQVAGGGDWTVVAAWDDGQRSMRATVGRGLPYVLAECDGGTPIVYASGSNVHTHSGGTLVLEKNGQYWGAYASEGATWSQSGDLWRCSGANAVSVAILPDGAVDTMEQFRGAALTAVRDTHVSWTWDPDTRTVLATYTFVTDPLPGGNGTVLPCLYRHQWLHTTAPYTGHTYPSPRGTLRLAQTDAFTVPFPLPPLLPMLPLGDAVDPAAAQAFLAESVGQGAASYVSDTYWGGKSLGRTAQLALVADALNDTATRTDLIEDLKSGLESWFVAGGDAEFAYEPQWGTLIGYPASYGADTELNDHHFHYGYFVWAAAVVARFDPDWAAPSAWGDMVTMLIRDAANWDRGDARFCFLRHFEPYVGHSYAAGHAGFAAGNNQESSSEAINFASGCAMWGAWTGDDAIRDLGLFLLAAESAAIEQYWFDADEVVYPDVMPRELAGIVWDAGASYSTWWTANAEEIHGINMLPITGGSLHLGGRPDTVSRLWDVFLAENGGPPTVWQDILWSYQALADPSAALAAFLAGGFSSEPGDSKARTYCWIAALDGLGQVDTTIGGDAPLSGVFSKDGVRTYVAHAAGDVDLQVRFTDGFTMCVPAGQTAARSASAADTCEVGDFNGDGVLDVSDLLTLLQAWGPCNDPPCQTDLNGDGTTNVHDLQALLAAW